MRVQEQATQTAVWLSILHFYAALLSILLEINFLQDSRGTQLSIYFMKAQPCTLVLPVAGRWTEQVSHSLTAHLLSLLHFTGCALRVADANWQSIILTASWHFLR